MFNPFLLFLHRLFINKYDLKFFLSKRNISLIEMLQLLIISTLNRSRTCLSFEVRSSTVPVLLVIAGNIRQYWNRWLYCWYRILYLSPLVIIFTIRYLIQFTLLTWLNRQRDMFLYRTIFIKTSFLVNSFLHITSVRKNDGKAVHGFKKRPLSRRSVNDRWQKPLTSRGA